ncbi:MAG TPA: dienelactone hydrolase family protein [Allosphingosinicella sp.]|jgi:dienelactone hydrolase
MDALEDFTTFRFSHTGKTRTVYRKGAGPAVIVMHEMPGITPDVARFARRVAAAGFSVFMPSLFGKPGGEEGRLPMARAFAQVCISREWSLLATDKASPVVDWLRALAAYAFAEIGGRGVGAVGMCITGNFALTMALDPYMVAPVLAEPSLPLRDPSGIHAAPETLAHLRKRHAEEGLTVLGLRFQGDKFCMRPRFDALKRELGDGFERVELPASAGRTRAPHSVLTRELVDEAGHPTRAALDRVLGFLGERLL